MEGVQDQDPRERARRNVRLAIIHALIAVGFMVAFFLVQAHR